MVREMTRLAAEIARSKHARGSTITKGPRYMTPPFFSTRRAPQ